MRRFEATDQRRARRWWQLVLTGALLFASAGARADALPNDTWDCVGKQPGDKCPNGTCVSSLCFVVDYGAIEAGLWVRDGAPYQRPPWTEEPCVQCLPGDLAPDGGPARHHDGSGCNLGGQSGATGLLAVSALALALRAMARRR